MDDAPYTFPRGQRPPRPGDTLCLGEGGLPMELLSVLPDGRFKVRWRSGGAEQVGLFDEADQTPWRR